VNILQALSDPRVFGNEFADRQSWAPWRAFLSALFGLPLGRDHFQLFQQCTGRTRTGGKPFREGYLVVGRRGGKSKVLALVACYLAGFKDWRPYLSSGEVGTIMIIAQDRRQAGIILGYVKALIAHTPMLAQLITGETAESIQLRNHIAIEVHTCSFRSTRGYTILAALLDEVAMWPDELSAEPDIEVLAAIKPGMLTLRGNAMLLAASSPFAKRGVLWDQYTKQFGQDESSVLIWQAPTRVMHAAVPQDEIDAAIAADPVKYRAEYLAEFRNDAESFASREAVMACVSPGIYERAPQAHTHYVGFCDPSGGAAGGDAMTLCVAHRDGDKVIVDAVREAIPPFNPDAVVAEFSQLLQSYCYSVTADKVGGIWLAESFRKHSIALEAVAEPKSILYSNFLPALNSQQVDLLDHDKLIRQLVGLERRPVLGGRDKIDHAQRSSAHDDLANAVAGCITSLIGSEDYDTSMKWVSTDAESARFRNTQYWSRYLNRIPL
jgi:hypothetical protein